MSDERIHRRPALTYVVNALNAGGTERLVMEMALAFSREFEVDVICLDEPGIWATELRDRGVAVSCLWRQGGLDLSIPLKLASHFRARGTQIVHAHQCTPWFYAALSRVFYPSTRLLLEEHGRFFPEVLNRKRIWFNRVITNFLTHRFVAVSEDIRRRLANFEGIPEKKIRVLYNGVAPPMPLEPNARTTLRAELGFGPEHFVVGAIGRLDPIKNLPLFIEGVSRLTSQRPHLRGVLIGDGPQLEDLQSTIAKRGLESRIRLTGFRSDARRLMQCLDLYVLCSFSEGTSMALLEAMSSGVPVAVTAVGGSPEIVNGGETGWLLPSDDAAALAAAIDEACGDAAKRARFAQSSRARFEAHFTFSRMVDEYRQLYAEMLGGLAPSHAARETG